MCVASDVGLGRVMCVASDVGLGRVMCVASAQCIDFVEIVSKAEEKDSNDDPYADLGKLNLMTRKFK